MRKKSRLPGVDYSKPLISDELPATQGLVNAVRMELKADIATLELQMKSGFAKVYRGFMELKKDLSEMRSLIAQMHANNEKQRNENRIVLDSLSLILERQDRVERRLEKVPLL